MPPPISTANSCNSPASSTADFANAAMIDAAEGFDNVSITKADGAYGALGLYDVTINGQTQRMTANDIARLQQCPVDDGPAAAGKGNPPSASSASSAPTPPAAATGSISPSDAVLKTETHGNKTLVAKQIHRNGMYAQLVTTTEATPQGLRVSQRLYRWDDFQNPDPIDVTAEASRSGPLSVEWNMPPLTPEHSGASAMNLVSETLVSEMPPSLVIPYVKDSILTEHFEFTPEGQNPYQHWADSIGRRWSATGARKTSFWLNKVVTVASAGVAATGAVNSAGKAVSTIKAAAKAEAFAAKDAARVISRFDLGKSVASNAEMVKGVRELETGLKPGLPGAVLQEGHTLTDLQRRALTENVRLVITKTVAAVKAGAGKQSLVNQLANPRFRFLAQVPNARAALIDALKGTGVTLPSGL